MQDSKHNSNDEIDLFELMMTIWQGKWLVAGVAVICTAIAIAVAFSMTPIYKVRSVLKPVHEEKLLELNSTGIYTTTPEKLFETVEKQVFAYQEREQFFLLNENVLAPILPSDTENNDRRIAKFVAENFKISRPPKDDPLHYVTLELTYPNTIDGVELLNGFVNQSANQIKNKIPKIIEQRIEQKRTDLAKQLITLRAGYKTKIDAEIAKLEENDQLRTIQLKDELNALRLELKTKRDNRIAQLNEAIEIATTLNYKKPTSPSSESNANKSSNVIRAELVQQASPLYFMGSEALTAERDALLKRENDDFTTPRIAEIEKELFLLENNRQVEMLKIRQKNDIFLAEIADIEKELAKLDTIKTDVTDFDVVEIDEQAQVPLNPIKPKKSLITIIGLLLGGILGVMIVLIRQAVRNRKLSVTK